MLISSTFHVKLTKSFQNILYLSTAVDDTFVFLAVVSVGRDALYHCDRLGRILYEYKFEHSIDSFCMMNKQEVAVLDPRDDRLYVFKLLEKKYELHNHQFLSEESDQSQVLGFSESSLICIKEKGKYNDNRLHLTYYKYPFLPKPVAKYESVDNQWTTDMEIFKGNNHSMFIWCKRRNDEEVDIRSFDLRLAPRGEFKQFRLKNTLGALYGISKMELSVKFAFEMRVNELCLVCLSNKNEARASKDSVVNNNFILNTQIPQSPFLRETKFSFDLPYNNFLIDYRNLGSYSMFRTYFYSKGEVQLSPVYYVSNRTESTVCQQLWKCSYLSKYLIPGYSSRLLIECEFENGKVDRFTVHEKRILSPEIQAKLTELHPGIDEHLMEDVNDLLEGT